MSTPSTDPLPAYRDLLRFARRVTEALVRSGVQLLTQVTEAPGGWAVEFADPDGHPVAFFQAQSLPRKL